MNAEEVRAAWADRAAEFSPRYYAYYGPDGISERLVALLESRIGAEVSILELGCGSGRHLAALHEAGYEDLHGLDLNDEAFAVMRAEYPDLWADGTFRAAAIEAVVDRLPDDVFDVVYTVETLQHLHPDTAWVFDELDRVTGELLIVVESEAGDGVAYQDDDIPLYYRDWGAIFADRGLTKVVAEPLEGDSLRAFRPA